MGRIRDLIDLYSVKEKEKRREKRRKLSLSSFPLLEKKQTYPVKSYYLLVITYGK
jgi:hypothetical protein